MNWERDWQLGKVSQVPLYRRDTESERIADGIDPLGSHGRVRQLWDPTTGKDRARTAGSGAQNKSIWRQNRGVSLSKLPSLSNCSPHPPRLSFRCTRRTRCWRCLKSGRGKFVSWESSLQVSSSSSFYHECSQDSLCPSSSRHEAQVT